MARRIATHHPEVPENPTVVAPVCGMIVPVWMLLSRVVNIFVTPVKFCVEILRKNVRNLMNVCIVTRFTLKSVRIGMSMFPVRILSVNQVKLCVIINLMTLTGIIVINIELLVQRVKESLAAHGNGSGSGGDDGEAPVDVVMNSIMTVVVIIGLIAIDFI